MRKLIAVLSLLASLPLFAATIEVHVTDAKGGPVDDAVVYAVPETRIPINRVVATMDQVNRTFVPHVLPIQAGTWVEFPNSDNIRHQVYSTSPARRFQLPLYVGKPAYPIQFPTPGAVLLGCNIHEQMSAWIVVVDTPFFAKTAAGATKLENVRAGKYTLHVWYPGMKAEPQPKDLLLGADATTQASFTIN
jgi:plastocyanin